MNETEIKNLIAAYQKKSGELLAQTIALDARVMTLSNTISELEEELVKLKKPKRTTKNTEEF
jgi:hypothetical protein|tara:strand:+ start:355 stop:540 length:186 start_codon:yes stop_codon:yes gene_type:complete